MILVKKDAELSLETVPYERFNIVISPPAAFKRGIPRTSGMLALALHVLHYRMLAASSRRTLYLHVRQLPSTRQGQCTVPYGVLRHLHELCTQEAHSSRTPSDSAVDGALGAAPPPSVVGAVSAERRLTLTAFFVVSWKSPRLAAA